MKRNTRHDAIKKIIAEKEISTQEELATALAEIGFITTQATVSRDIRELGLIKTSGKEKKFKYALKKQSDFTDSKIANIFKESVISIESSLNLLVVKTSSGTANGAAYFLDNLNLPEILGTISGDDTVLVIARSINDTPILINKLKGYIK